MASLENFWSQDPKEVLKLLDSSLEGFSSSQAKKRYLSTLSKKKRQSSFQKDLRLLIRQFQSPLVMLLLGAVILSGFIGERSDVIIILVILILAVLMSFFRNAMREG